MSRAALMLCAWLLCPAFAFSAMQNVGVVFIPDPMLSTDPRSSTNTTMDGASEALWYVFQAPQTGSIRKLGFHTATVTTGCTVDARVETVSAANGQPSGGSARGGDTGTKSAGISMTPSPKQSVCSCHQQS